MIPASTRRGAYGLVLPTIADQALLNDAPSHWVPWQLGFRVAPDGDQPAETVGDDDATIHVAPDGYARIDRAAASTVISMRGEPSPHGEVHPYLGSTAIMAAQWSGRTSFHSGSFVLDGGVWAILGHREQGKSSTLAWLAREGYAIFADDLLVLDSDVALAGPRCLDLRQEAAERFGIGSDIGVVGTRRRWRVRLPAVAPVLPFRGWILLSWSDTVRVDTVPPSARLTALLPSRALLTTPTDARVWLNLVTSPMFVFGRPKAWDHLDSAMMALLDQLAGV